MCAKFRAVMEKISVNQLKKSAPQLGHVPQKGKNGISHSLLLSYINCCTHLTEVKP